VTLAGTARRLGLAGGSHSGRTRNRAFLGAVGAAVLLVAVAVLALVARRRDEQAAMRRALGRELSNAAVMLLDRVLAERELAERSLTAPVHGLLATDGGPRLRLSDFSRSTSELLGGLALEGDTLAGTFRIDLAAPWPTPESFQVDGALRRDAKLARVVLARLAERRASLGEPTRDSTVASRVQLRGFPVTLLRARQRDGAGRPVALFGLTYAASHWYARMLPPMLCTLPLLPPTFYGVDWTTERPAGHASDPTDPLTIVQESSARHNGVLAILVAGPDGAPAYRSPGADSAAFASRTRARLVLDGIDILVALPDERAERLVAAAAPIGPEGWLLAGVALLGALFVVGATMQLRRQHQLAEERRNFVAAISHELRTPLAHVVLMTETLLGPAVQTDDQRRRWLTVIHREAVRLGRLVDNVLLHTRAERRDVGLDLQPVDVGELAREVVASLGTVAASRRARVHAVAPPSAEVRADPGAVRQVLLNLVDNALRYGPDGQTVLVTVTPPRAPGEPLVLTIEDEGPGIPPADRRRVWAPFVRLGDRGGVTGGSGLGLSVVRDLVQRHGGAVEITDAKGGGARLVVTLPARAPVTTRAERADRN